MSNPLADLTPEQLQAAHDLVTPRLTKYITHEPTPRQIAGLIALDHRREVLFGGAAGGGKSDWLLMAALQYVDVPGYSALLLRRTFAQLSKAGALMDRAKEWLMNTDAEWMATTMTWHFPSGATLEFGHMQHEDSKYNYQGPEYQFVGFDELTQFQESQYRYLHSRTRRLVGVDIPIRVASTSNPGGKGHAWVKSRLVEGSKTHPQRAFIPSKLQDNPYLDREAYIESLQELDPVTLKQLLDGDWDVRPPGALFKREQVQVIPAPPAKLVKVARGWDFAASKPTDENPDPDWSAGVLLGMDEHPRFYVLHVDRWRLEASDTEQRFSNRLAIDHETYPGTAHRLEQEPGSSGKLACNHLVVSNPGYDITYKPSTGDKVVRARPFAAQWQVGNVYIIAGAWNDDYFDEMEAFGPDCPHDDQVDGSSSAFTELTQEPPPQVF